MQDWLAHPAIHAGVLPLLVALAVATALYRSRLAWLAVVAGYATVVALTTGFTFSPLTVSRKVLLLVLLAPLAGLAADALPHRARLLHALLATGAGLLSVWVFITVLAQRDAAAAVPAGAAIAAFVGALVWLMLRLRDDGAAAGAAGLGLGLAVGIAALLSASLGYFGSGVAVAAACGALLLVQLFSARLIEPGFTGTLPIGLAAALFAVAAMLLAQLPWYALPLLLLVASSAAVPPAAATSIHARIVALSLIALAAAILPILAAFHAASATSG